MNKKEILSLDKIVRIKLIKAIKSKEIVKGVINIRNKKCKKNEKKYKTMYLIKIKNGKKEQIYIPKKWEEKVKTWVKNYRGIKNYIEQLSDIYIKKIKQRME